MRPLLLLLFAFAGLALVSFAPPARADTACSASFDSLDFGIVDTLSTAGTKAASGVHLSCTGVPDGTASVAACIALGAGSGGADGSARLLTGTDGTLRYGLYMDDADSQPWGTGASLGEPQRVVLTVSNGQASSDIWLYGLVYGSQSSVVPATYSSSFGDADITFYYEAGNTLDCSAPDVSGVGATLSVAAQVSPNCLVSTGDLNFGATGAIDQNIDAAADIAVTCTPGTSYTMSLDGGTSNATSPDQRQMHSGSNHITYGLYSDTSRTQPWGQDLQAKSGAGLGEQELQTVYGRVPPQQAAVGSYTDTVVVTISYDDGS
ncbi:MAG: spore coat protein U domain-containing protein [Devosia sp.]|nr:spore coat protein U domain-containing protein [Devosia sp.]